MEQYARVYAQINLDAVIHNMQAMQAHLADGAKMIGVLKADGYGHGAVPVAQVIDPYVAGYAVAAIEEARNLQMHGITKPILILGATHPGRSRELVRYGIRPTVFTMEQARALSAAAAELNREWGYAVENGRKDGDLQKPVRDWTRIADAPDDAEEGLQAESAKLNREWRYAVENDRKDGDLQGSVRPAQAVVHLAVDTGMSRIGLSCDEEGAKLAAAIGRLPGIRVEGIYTHFARSDEKDKTPALRQWEKYWQFIRMTEAEGLTVPFHHTANSAAVIGMPETHWDGVRAGISIYGMYPSDEVDRTRVKLEPVLSLHSFVTCVKEIPAGTEVSYGGTFTAGRTTKVATVSAGYADGYPRDLSGRGSVLIRGRRAPILGRVCMDQFMADVTDIPYVAVDDPVTLIGRDGAEQITVEELEHTGGRLRYEIVCDIGKRVPRIYVRGGRVVGTKDYFDDRYEDFLPGR